MSWLPPTRPFAEAVLECTELSADRYAALFSKDLNARLGRVRQVAGLPSDEAIGPDTLDPAPRTQVGHPLNDNEGVEWLSLLLGEVVMRSGLSFLNLPGKNATPQTFDTGSQNPHVLVQQLDNVTASLPLLPGVTAPALTAYRAVHHRLWEWVGTDPDPAPDDRLSAVAFCVTPVDEYVREELVKALRAAARITGRLVTATPTHPTLRSELSSLKRLFKVAAESASAASASYRGGTAKRIALELFTIECLTLFDALQRSPSTSNLSRTSRYRKAMRLLIDGVALLDDSAPSERTVNRACDSTLAVIDSLDGCHGSPEPPEPSEWVAHYWQRRKLAITEWSRRTELQRD